MRYYPKLNVYKASNVRYDVATKQAWSHDWWCFTKVIEGKLVFNRHKYSITTQAHQRKVMKLLNLLGIAMWWEVDIREGLQNVTTWKQLEGYFNEVN